MLSNFHKTIGYHPMTENIKWLWSKTIIRRLLECAALHSQLCAELVGPEYRPFPVKWVFISTVNEQPDFRKKQKPTDIGQTNKWNIVTYDLNNFIQQCGENNLWTTTKLIALLRLKNTSNSLYWSHFLLFSKRGTQKSTQNLKMYWTAPASNHSIIPNKNDSTRTVRRRLRR